MSVLKNIPDTWENRHQESTLRIFSCQLFTDNFFKQQTVILDSMTEKEVIQSIAIGASAVHKLFLNKEGCGAFCKLVENFRSDIFLSEAFTQDLTRWWAQSVHICALRAKSWLSLTLFNYTDLLYP